MKNISKKLIISVLVILVVLLGFKVILNRSNERKELMNNICKSIEAGDIDTYSSYMEKNYLSFDESEIEIVKDTEKGAMNDLKDIYGDNFKISFKFKKEVDLLKESKDVNTSKLYEVMGLDKDEVEEMYRISYTYKINGDSESITDDAMMFRVCQ